MSISVHVKLKTRKKQGVGGGLLQLSYSGGSASGILISVGWNFKKQP